MNSLLIRNPVELTILYLSTTIALFKLPPIAKPVARIFWISSANAKVLALAIFFMKFVLL